MTTAASKALDATLVFYVPGERSIIDSVSTSTGLGHYGGQSLEQTRAETGKDVQVVTLAEASAAIEAVFISLPERCTADDYERAFCAMPPINYGSSHGVEIFQMQEFTSGRVTGTFAKTDGEFFAWQDVAYTPRAELAQKALSAMSGMSGSTPPAEAPVLSESPFESPAPGRGPRM